MKTILLVVVAVAMWSCGPDNSAVSQDETRKCDPDVECAGTVKWNKDVHACRCAMDQETCAASCGMYPATWVNEFVCLCN